MLRFGSKTKAAVAAAYIIMTVAYSSKLMEIMDEEVGSLTLTLKNFRVRCWISMGHC